MNENGWDFFFVSCWIQAKRAIFLLLSVSLHHNTHPHVNSFIMCSCLCSHQTIDLFVYGIFLFHTLIHHLYSLICSLRNSKRQRQRVRERNFLVHVCMHIICFCTIFPSIHRAIRFEKPFTRPLIKIHIGHVNDGRPTRKKSRNTKQPDNTKQKKQKPKNTILVGIKTKFIYIIIEITIFTNISKWFDGKTTQETCSFFSLSLYLSTYLSHSSRARERAFVIGGDAIFFTSHIHRQTYNHFGHSAWSI